MSTIRLTIHLSNVDRLDITIAKKGKVIEHFVINYSAKFEALDNEWREVYRVDTCHGYLHEQRFWISEDPIEMKFEYEKSLKSVFEETMDLMKKDYHHFKRLYLLKKLEEEEGDGEP